MMSQWPISVPIDAARYVSAFRDSDKLLPARCRAERLRVLAERDHVLRAAELAQPP
ncbi:MAG: hypothetical protein JWN04_2924 [Myxococcaceae bacterium]|nr:hypothetical protein [Myxococcaceae bacterium]